MLVYDELGYHSPPSFSKAVIIELSPGCKRQNSRGHYFFRTGLSGLWFSKKKLPTRKGIEKDDAGISSYSLRPWSGTRSHHICRERRGKGERRLANHYPSKAWSLPHQKMTSASLDRLSAGPGERYNFFFEVPRAIKQLRALSPQDGQSRLDRIID